MIQHVTKSRTMRAVSRLRFDRARLALAFAALLAGCSSLGPYHEQPTVVLKSFRPLPSGGGIPGFEIGLGVINPSRDTLELYGVSYTISVQGFDLVKGVGRDFPPVEPYSEATLLLTAQPNLLAGIRMFSELMRAPTDAIEYELDAKLDTGGWAVPIRVSEKGTFNLSPQSGATARR